jgi:hypothetical protein
LTARARSKAQRVTKSVEFETDQQNKGKIQKENQRKVEETYRREKRLFNAGVIGREGPQRRAIKDCKFTSGVNCR